MPRRPFALLLGLCLVTACGSAPAAQGSPAVASPSPGRADTVAAEAAFGLLGQLDEAWRTLDCAAVEHFTTWAENVLGGRACEATRNDRPASPPGRPPSSDSKAPDLGEYSAPEFFLPAEDDWFAALATKPSPAYFVFVREDEIWRLAAGPIPLVDEAPSLASDVTPAPETAVKARLVPQRHVTYLTDPAGVSGVRFPSGDPVRDLFSATTEKQADVRLVPGPTRALALADGAMLVFHALEIDASDHAVLATRITPGNKLSTVAIRQTSVG